MQKIIFSIICCMFFVCCNSSVENVQEIKKEYVSEYDIISKYSRLRDIEPFNKLCDSIFEYKINNNNIIFYSNYDGFNSFIVFCGKNKNKIIYTSPLLDVSLLKLSNKNYLLKIVKNTDFTINETTYFLLSDNLDSGIIDNISFVSEGAYMWSQDTATFENIQRTVFYKMKDSICSSKIFLNIMLNGEQIYDSVNIKNNKFVIPQKLDTLKWDNTYILEKKER